MGLLLTCTTVLHHTAGPAQAAAAGVPNPAPAAPPGLSGTVDTLLACGNGWR
jgi:hypothetical protein